MATALFFIVLITLLTVCIIHNTKRAIKLMKSPSHKMIKKSQTSIHILPDNDPEFMEMEYNQYIENCAQYIRMVVVIYIDSIIEPYPYLLKKNIPYLIDAHHQVNSFFNTKFYPQIIEYAWKDMFESKMKIQTEEIDKYKNYFKEYTSNPSSLNLHNIERNMPERYLKNMDISIFEQL